MVGFVFHIEDARGVGARKRERLGVIDVNESLESMNHLLYVHPSAGAVALVLLSVVETDSASTEEGTYSATASGENTHLSWLLGTFQLSCCIYLRGEDVMEKEKKIVPSFTIISKLDSAANLPGPLEKSRNRLVRNVSSNGLSPVTRRCCNLVIFISQRPGGQVVHLVLSRFVRRMFVVCFACMPST